jgi:hypothetical protein
MLTFLVVDVPVTGAAGGFVDADALDVVVAVFSGAEAEVARRAARWCQAVGIPGGAAMRLLKNQLSGL